MSVRSMSSSDIASRRATCSRSSDVNGLLGSSLNLTLLIPPPFASRCSARAHDSYNLLPVFFVQIDMDDDEEGARADEPDSVPSLLVILRLIEPNFEVRVVPDAGRCLERDAMLADIARRFSSVPLKDHLYVRLCTYIRKASHELAPGLIDDAADVRDVLAEAHLVVCLARRNHREAVLGPLDAAVEQHRRRRVDHLDDPRVQFLGVLGADADAAEGLGQLHEVG